jgi:glycine betaine catabolism B
MGYIVKVAERKDIQPSTMKAVEVSNERYVCLANVEGKYYAIGNVCTHLGEPLAEGKLEGYEIQCPWHGSRFDIRTGKITRLLNYCGCQTFYRPRNRLNFISIFNY